MGTYAGKTCVWCDKEKAVRSIYDDGRPIYCEKCQRELLKELGVAGALERWEQEHQKQ